MQEGLTLGTRAREGFGDSGPQPVACDLCCYIVDRLCCGSNAVDILAALEAAATRWGSGLMQVYESWACGIVVSDLHHLHVEQVKCTHTAE